MNAVQHRWAEGTCIATPAVWRRADRPCISTHLQRSGPDLRPISELGSWRSDRLGSVLIHSPLRPRGVPTLSRRGIAEVVAKCYRRRMSQPVKISDELIVDARLTAEIAERSIAGQIEFWAQLGRSIEPLLEGSRALALRRAGATVPPV